MVWDTTEQHNALRIFRSPTAGTLSTTSPWAAIADAEHPSPDPPLANAPLDSAQAAQWQQHRAQHPGVPVESTNSIGMKFRVIPPGAYEMKYASDNALRKPQSVTVTRSFELGAYEVTQTQYLQIMGDNPSHLQNLQHPVQQITWTEAVEFYKKLSE